MIELALYQPEIPPNTGTIARQCAGLGVRLNLIGPIGFDLSEKAVRRAGLDYWEHVDLKVHDSPDDFLAYAAGRTCWMVTKFGQQRYDQVNYQENDIIVCGNELKGLPDSWHQKSPEQCIYLPMKNVIRSFNLANSAAIVLNHAMSESGLFDRMPETFSAAHRDQVQPDTTGGTSDQ